MQTKTGYLPLGRNTAQLYAEYRDEVDKYNKKQDILLGKHMRVIQRQERIAHSFMKKTRNEIQQLKSEIRGIEERSLNLREYDSVKQKLKTDHLYLPKRRQDAESTHYNFSSSYQSSLNNSVNESPRHRTKLPPLWARKQPGKKDMKSKLMSSGQPKALSMRALRHRPVLTNAQQYVLDSNYFIPNRGEAENDSYYDSDDESHYRTTRSDDRFTRQSDNNTGNGEEAKMMYGSLDSLHQILPAISPNTKTHSPKKSTHTVNKFIKIPDIHKDFNDIVPHECNGLDTIIENSNGDNSFSTPKKKYNAVDNNDNIVESPNLTNTEELDSHPLKEEQHKKATKLKQKQGKVQNVSNHELVIHIPTAENTNSSHGYLNNMSPRRFKNVRRKHKLYQEHLHKNSLSVVDSWGIVGTGSDRKLKEEDPTISSDI